MRFSLKSGTEVTTLTDDAAVPLVDDLDVEDEGLENGWASAAAFRRFARAGLVLPSDDTHHRELARFNAFTTTTTTAALIDPAGVFTEINGAGPAQVTQDSLAGGLPGVAGLSAGNAANGRCTAYLLNGGLSFNAAASDFSFGARIRVPILSTGADKFEVRLGLLGAVGATYPANAIMLRLQHGDANWEAVTRAADNESGTVADTGVVAVAGTWRNWRIDRTPGGSAKFYMDGTQVAELSTHFPADATALFPAVGIYRGDTAANARTVQVKYLRWELAFDVNAEQLARPIT